MQWFESWFNTTYYHLLYQNRDDQEAQRFLDQLLAYLAPPLSAKLLDLACGKGRHARYLASKGFDVTGIDLSTNSIQAASAFEQERLRFVVGDMRESYKTNHFDYIFNFFTSFGYFSDTKDNDRSLAAIHESLRPQGKLVIDFLHAEWVIAHLVKKEMKVIEGIRFDIKREVKDGIIYKHIHISDQEKQLHFTEKVQALTATYFRTALAKQGFNILKEWGDYDLGDFDANSSKRYIVLAERR